ncbi:MAG: hypothetical protein HYZ17_04895 [Betaproteobacteria bacterium]|nr:hypothetical protein [Betaproteobacteria bacterium]
MNPNIRVMALGLLVAASGCGSAAGPGAEDLKRALEAQLQKLRPQGFQERTVLYQEITPSGSSDGRYQFKVSLTLHDYGKGYPANRYWGQTCVGKMDKWPFDLVPDGSGGWLAQGRLTISDRVCKDNPAEGKSAMPLAGLVGKPLGVSAAPATKSTTAGTGTGGGSPQGEWACFGSGGRLMAGMGFVLKPGGKYTDSDGGRGGSYRHDAALATLSFRGGFLDGQIGRNVRARGLDLTRTVNCEPYR